MVKQIVIGSVFERLTVIADAAPSRSGKRRALCRCICGKEKIIQLSNLPNGHIRSCGCLRSENTAEMKHVHGGYGTPLYKIWSCMKDRCTNPRSLYFRHYGGRGISVCPEWTEDFSAFRDYVGAHLGERPSPRHSIDRINNDQGYEPANIRWATRLEQARNQRNNVLVEYLGETLPMAVWAERLAITPQTLWKRARRGWTLEDSFNVRAGSAES